MATPLSGQGIFAVSFATVGSPHISVITCGFLNSPSKSAAVCNATLRGALNFPGCMFSAAVMGTNFSIVNTYVLINTGGLLTVDNDPTALVGTVVLANPPLNTAVIVRKNTALAGRQYRGRMFAPPVSLDESLVSVAGIIAPARVATLQTEINVLFTRLTTGGMAPQLLHDAPLVGPTPPTTALSSFGITSKIGTIKRRIRS